MEVLRGQVPLPAIAMAEGYIRSLPPGDERSIPEHTNHRSVLDLLVHLPAQTGRLEDPHIVWHSNGSETLSAPHIDEPRVSGMSDQLGGPGQRLYDRILGVAITKQTKQNGAVVFGRNGDSERPVAVMEPGDVLSFAGDEYHMTGRPASEEPRIIVYFRFLPWG